jgi:hypothetical protein
VQSSTGTLSVAMAVRDAGGARCIGPVADLLVSDGHAVQIHASDPGLSLLRDDGVTAELVATDDKITETDAAELLDRLHPDILFTAAGFSTSLEHPFRIAARGLGIPSVAIVDYPSNYSPRFVRPGESFENNSIPDIVCAIDEASGAGLVDDARIPEARIHLTGSPAIELSRQTLLRLRSGTSNSIENLSRSKQVLAFMSEPVPGNTPEERRPINVLVRWLDLLHDASEKSGSGYTVLVKPHPAERIDPLKAAVAGAVSSGDDVTVVEGSNARDVIARADAVFGLTTVALAEAGFAEVPSYSLQPWLQDNNGMDACFASQQGVAHLLRSWDEAEVTAHHLFKNGPDLLSETAHMTDHDGATRRVADIVVSISTNVASDKAIR